MTGVVIDKRDYDSMAWAEQGACRGSKSSLWFPEPGKNAPHALAICKECPVRAECLDYAMVNGERFGVWGGTTEKDRRKLRHRYVPLAVRS